MTTDRYKATLNGIEIEFETIDDNFQKAIVRHEFPYVNGAQLEDMGQNAREVRIRCYFMNDRYPDHITLLNRLQSTVQSEFVHPQYGVMKGSIQSVTARHNERQLTAEMDITFIQELITDVEPMRVEDVQQACEQHFITAQDEQMTVYSSTVIDELGTEGYAILAMDLNPAQSVLGQLTGLSMKARNYMKQVDGIIGGMNATLNMITNPANGLIASISYGTRLPGLVIGSIARAMERYAILYASLRTAPCRFLSSLRFAIIDLENKFPKFTGHTKRAGACRLGVEASYCYKIDETARRAVDRRAGERVFDSLGNYLPPDAADPVMTMNDIEASLALVRAVIQDVVDDDRTQESLKALALALLRHVNEIKLNRDKIVTTLSPIEMPLHLLCLRQGLPYSYADRILRINNIRNPNFTPPGEVKVYVQ